jgi:hypothetical protein
VIVLAQACGERYHQYRANRRGAAMDIPLIALCRTTLLCAVALLATEVPSIAGADPLPGITVEAQRERDKLRHDVNEFVSAAIVKPFGDSFMRWNSPVCPLVAGLTREEGEFVLHRLSDIARSVRAPLGREDCKPNFFVIAARNPAVFLKLWWRRNPGLFDTRPGIAPVKHFIETPRPIRVWYNAHDIPADAGVAFTSLLAQSSMMGKGTLDVPTFVQPSSLGSRLTFPVVRDIANAIVVVNPLQIDKLKLAQLVDYIGLIGLAQINLDKDLGQAPTILKVFNASETSPPLEMTSWDKALLRSLYMTPQKDRMQLSEMETVALNDIASKSVH